MHLTQKQANNKDLIRYLAEQVVPENITSIDPLSGGVISYNFEVNRHIIFKLPSRKTPTESWIQQTQYAPVLQKHLSCQIPHPKVQTVFLNSTAHEGLLSSAYEKIEGNTIPQYQDFFKKERSFKTHYFEQLADLAHQIHSVPDKSLPVKIPTGEEFLKQFFSQRIGKITPFQEKILNKIIHSSVIGLDENLSERTLCHCDLRSANVCLDEKNRIIGILDFDSLNRGEPFFEFRPLLYGFGKQEADTKLFYQIYCARTGYTTDLDNLKKMRHLFLGLYAFVGVCKLANINVIKGKIGFLKEIKKVCKDL